MKHFTLDANGYPIHEPDEAKWKDWLATAPLHVADDTINASRISTMFIGVQFEDADDTLWETAVLGGALDQVKDRCAGSREQAEAMHARMLERIRNL